MFCRSHFKLWLVPAALLVCATCMVGIPAEEGSRKRPSIGTIEKTDEHPFSFEVVGLPEPLLEQLAKLEPTDEAFAKIFTVTVATEKGQQEIPPVGGKYFTKSSRLVFEPRFPVRPGVTYRAVVYALTPEGEVRKVLAEQEVQIPVPASDANRPATEVLRVYPTADVLPENHLRFYIHFSQPMSRAVAYENLALLDEKGQVVEAAFLELGEELWDPGAKRFTLLLDPGRIKRGLKPREDLGPILEAGKQYTLVVKRHWPDAYGHPLKNDLKKTFKVGPPQEAPLDVAEWKVSKPVAGQRGILGIHFPHPLDHALAERLINVVDSAGQQVEGEAFTCNAEKQWNFRPEEMWKAGKYELVVDTVLEDSVGNRIGRPFEVDQIETVTRKVIPEFVRIPFEVKEKAAATP